MILIFEAEISILWITIDKFCNKSSKVVHQDQSKLKYSFQNIIFFSFDKRRKLFKAFMESQFKYYLVIEIFHSQRDNNKINRL